MADNAKVPMEPSHSNHHQVPGRVLADWDYDTWFKSVTLPHYPEKDFRDMLPPTMEQVYLAYQPVVQNGRWTFGLLDMWGNKAKLAKSAVHVPCWNSFSVNPCKWRGPVVGRTCHECFWLGLHQTRWARAAYAAHLGREYNVPCSSVPESHWRGRIVALCGFDFAFAIGASVGFAQVIAVGGQLLNFAACYDCHAREKMRRKFNLPTTFCLPAGIDDCCVHFLCFYCASHQEMRELAVRGVDGPGLHVLDVSPKSFAHLPGYEEAVAMRAKRREELMLQAPTFFPFEDRLRKEPGMAHKLAARLHTAREAGLDVPVQPDVELSQSTASTVMENGSAKLL